MIDPKLIFPPEFATAKIDSLNSQPCSPKMGPPGWRGLLLHAPQWVQQDPKRSTIIPVCGVYVLPMTPVDVMPSGILHCRIKGFPEILPQHIGLDDPENESGPAVSLLTPEQRKTASDGGYFSFNLAPYIALPHVPVRIDLALEMRGVMSPPVTVEWRPIEITPPTRH